MNLFRLARPVLVAACAWASMGPTLRGELILEDFIPGGEDGYELGRGIASRLVPIVDRAPGGARIGQGQEPAATLGFEGSWLRRVSSNMLLTIPENIRFPGIHSPAGSGSISTTATGGDALVRNASRRIVDYDGAQTLWFAATMQVNKAALDMAEPEVTTHLLAFLSDAPPNFTNWDPEENHEIEGVAFGLFGGNPVLRYQSDAAGTGRVENALFSTAVEAGTPYLFLARLHLDDQGEDVLDGWFLTGLPVGGESSLDAPHVSVTANVLSGPTGISYLSAIIRTPVAPPQPRNSVQFDAIRMATSYEAVTATNPFRLRTITYNIYRCHGWPRVEENRQRRHAASTQIATRIAEELLLYQPDFVTLQEADTEEVVVRIAGRMGMHYAYFPSKGTRTTPGAVLSRYNITESTDRPLASPDRDEDDLFTRHWGRALLETPVGEVAVFSAHLHAWDWAQEIRLREISRMLEMIEQDVAAGHPVILQGDLNFRPDTEEHRLLTEAGLVDAFLAGGEGEPATIPSDEPRGRIDYVFLGGRFRDSAYYSRVLFEGAFRTNPGDPRSFALSDHLPVLADIKYRREAR